MITIGELSRISHLSVRTLRYYDRIGLLPPAQITEAGYRLYDDSTLQRLYTILLYRELEFPLADIRRLLDEPGFDLCQALETQITLLTMKREHLDNLILLAKGFKLKGMKNMHVSKESFEAFDHRKMDDYVAQAKAAWGNTDAYREYVAKAETRTENEELVIEKDMMALISSFGTLRHLDPACDDAQAAVQQLRDFITRNFYDCKVPILRGLADMYDGGGDFTRNIDQAGGQGTASFLAQAMRIYCNRNR